ncbi:unnamed protein product (macronuclear) [Paramecium tetraurelia]|uniref:Uncharacterized protein n=1 Tax=Paramecium tetraurelia TaxID=5888 RepID=A0DB91_PARTE|nr:uncharacterized protein GSPATT00015202001 [Paramecium tetraurelia]CAK80308.1 unnamed protein product [Paramecium tetraurelia]|eukprot:XP_001447705.1 hypothetical protein (macronuclear) [Paramecium tetraurelia strain d4-2]
MKNIVIQFYDKNEQFETFCDSKTTSMTLASFIQDASYYDQFNMSEIFYFKIKDTDYYFAQRNTPIYKYISNIDNPTLIFYRGLNGQQNLKSCKKIEDSKNQADNINFQQQKDILKGYGLYNTFYQNQPEQTSQAKSQQSKQGKIIISEIPTNDNSNQSVNQCKNKNSQSVRLNELSLNAANSAYREAQNSIQLQRVEEKSNSLFVNSIQQYSGKVNQEINVYDQHLRKTFIKESQMPSNQQKYIQSSNQQKQSPQKFGLLQKQLQDKKKSQKKDKWLISVDASGEQLQSLVNFLKTNNIQYTCDKQYS